MSIPQNTKHAVKRRARGCCEDCGQPAALELHHRHYETVGAETESDLSALCRDCHRRRHVDLAGDFWRDPQEKENYWATYFSELGK